MNTPKVSIIMPVYNTEKYVGAAIESVLNQTLQDWELILVNDGSTDGSMQVLQHYANLDKRLKIINQLNLGQSEARNIGLKASVGNYIYFLDSDDLIVPQTLDTCLMRCSLYNLDFLFFDVDTLVGNKEFANRVTSYHRELTKPQEIRDGLSMLHSLLSVNEYLVSVCLLFISRAFLIHTGLRFYKGILHEDEIFTTLLFLKAKSVMYLAESFFLRRVRESSIMTSTIKMRNIDSYFIVASTIQAIAKEHQSYRQVVDLYLTKLLNAVLWKAHVMPVKNRLNIANRAITSWSEYIEIRSVLVLLFRKYLIRR